MSPDQEPSVLRAPGPEDGPQVPAVMMLVSNLARIQGLAKGASDAVRLCREETDWQGTIRTFMEIERLAGELLPAAACAAPETPKGSEGPNQSVTQELPQVEPQEEGDKE